MSAVPIWVTILFFVLVCIGIKRCFTSVMKVKRFVILPVALLYLSLHDLYQTMLQHPPFILLWVCSFLIAGALGVYHVRDKLVRADRKNWLIEIPGDWTMLLLILLIFVMEFFVNYAIDSHAVYATANWFVALVMFFSGVAIGFTTGRNSMYFWKFLHSQSVSLQN